MFCAHCGTKGDEGQKYCKLCGSQIMGSAGIADAIKKSAINHEGKSLSRKTLLGGVTAAILAAVLVSVIYVAASTSVTSEQEVGAVATSTLASTSAQVAIAEQKHVEDIPKIDSIINAKPLLVPSTSVGFTVSEIVSSWQNRVAQVFCVTNGGDSSGGAATLVTLKGGLYAITNDHVIDDGAGGAPDSCGVGIYGLGARLINRAPGRFGTEMDQGVDVGVIALNDADYQNDDGLFDAVAKNYMPVCSESDVQIGDEIVILGYPWNGSQTSVTASRGIVSGYDGDYYVTDAKIEHGNSGGAAILSKKNCWLGIPTSAVVGSVESYGRILKGSDILE